MCDLFERLEQVLLAVALCNLLLWSKPAEVSAALRLQVAAAVQMVVDAVKDDSQRAREQATVAIGTCT